MRERGADLGAFLLGLTVALEFLDGKDVEVGGGGGNGVFVAVDDAIGGGNG